MEDPRAGDSSAPSARWPTFAAPRIFVVRIPRPCRARLALLEGELAEARRRRGGRSARRQRQHRASPRAPRVVALRQELHEQKAAKDGVSAALRRASDLAARAHAGPRTREDRDRKCETSSPSSPARENRWRKSGCSAGLSSWREKLESTAHAGRWSSAQVGLGAVDRRGGRLHRGRARDWRGRGRPHLEAHGALGALSARRAQMQALAARGLVAAPDVESHARQAEALLAARPTPLREATAELETYEATVIELAARGRQH